MDNKTRIKHYAQTGAKTTRTAEFRFPRGKKVYKVTPRQAKRLRLHANKAIGK